MKEVFPSISAELDDRLMARHKVLFTQVVMPTIAATAVVLVIAYWRFDPKFYSGLAIMVSLNFLNAYYSVADRIIRTPWGVVHSRSDGFDTFRWCCNLSLDVYLLWCFEVSAPVAAFTWTILSFGALTEVYRPRNKLITVSFAIVGFTILMFYVFPSTVREQLYVTFTYVGLLYVLWKLETYVIEEMGLFHAERGNRERIESQAEQFRWEAAVGQSVRSITHELNNLISVGNHAVEAMKTDDSQQHVERLEKMLEYMAQVNHLALDDLGNKLAPIRDYSLEELFVDFRLLVSGTDWTPRVPIRLVTEDIEQSVIFSERAGATYFIVHNLVRNAYDAVVKRHPNPQDGHIDIVVSHRDDVIVFSVQDNGIGMSPEQQDAIEAGEAITGKAGGHGLGLLFAKREVATNHFQLRIESAIDAGSRFDLLVPVAASPA